MTLLADMACSSASPSVPSLHIQPICEPHTTVAEPLTNTHTKMTVMYTNTHAETLTLCSYHYSNLPFKHTRISQKQLALVRWLTSKEDSYQISFRSAMKDQFIKNALNMNGFS